MTNNRYTNWQNSVNIDYLSLYIKTWFAFLSTVQNLHPHAINSTGDGSLISVYRQTVGIPSAFESMMLQHIKKVHSIGYRIIQRDVPNSFFISFYKLNNNFLLEVENELKTYKTQDNNRIYDKSFLKIEYKDVMNGISKKNLLITIKSTARKFLDNLDVHHICFNLPIDDLIDTIDSDGTKIFMSKDSIITMISSRLTQRLYSHISQISNLEIEDIEERKGYCNGLISPLIQLIRQRFLINHLFEYLPVENFPNDFDVNNNQLKILNWFISFNYSLRNLLFHSIIDPFDPDWLKLFKHSYLSLKELVEHNIFLLENRSISDI